MMQRPQQLLIGLWSLCLAVSTQFVVAADALEKRAWNVENAQREALVHIPAIAKESPAPVVFVFHGHGGTMRHAARMFRIHELWPQAICVYMQGLKTPGRLTDPEGKKAGWQHMAGDHGDRDFKFFDAVLETLLKEAKVSDTRVFSTGHSNGGGFTYLLWSERHQQLAAVAPSASAAMRRLNTLQPKPAMHIAGRNDPLVKFEWQEATIQSLRKLNQCSDSPSAWSGDLGKLYKSPINAPVVAVIHDGDHKFPTFAPEAIVQFFQQYQDLSAQ